MKAGAAWLRYQGTKMHYPMTTSALTAWLLAMVMALAGGCTVQYVAEYDASIKEEIVEVAKKVDLFWGELLDVDESQRTYDRFKMKYNEIETDIRALVMKNEIRPLNSESTKQAQLALELWAEDRANHKEKDTISDFIAKRHRRQYTQVFTAMAKGEEAKNIDPGGES